MGANQKYEKKKLTVHFRLLYEQGVTIEATYINNKVLPLKQHR